MAATSVFPNGNYRSFGTILSDTSQTAVYTCPSNIAAAVVVWIDIADDAGANVSATIEWTDSSASTDFTLEYQYDIPLKDRFQEALMLVLEPGDSLNVTGSQSGMHVTVTAVEIPKGART